MLFEKNIKTDDAISGTEFGKTLLTSAANIAKEVKQTVGKIPIPKGITPALVTLDGEIIKFPSFEMAKLGEVTKAMESRAAQMLSGVKKAVNLPAFEKLSFRIDPGEVKPHFLTGHKTDGGRLAQSLKDGGKKTIFPEWMTEKQIYSAIEDAYKNSTKAKSTKNFDVGKVITLDGYSKKFNLKIRIHLNLDLKQIESAYPRTK